MRTPAGRRLLQGKAWPGPGHVLTVEAAAAQWGAVASVAGQQGTEQSAGSHGGSALGGAGLERTSQGVERGEEGAGVFHHFDSRAWGGLWASSRGGGGALGHGSHVLATRRPLKLFDEQVAGIEVSKVGRRFRPLPGQIWTWVFKQSCQPRFALLFLFKSHGH